MKIVYFGSDVFLNVYRYLKKNHEILALYTYHNDEDYFEEYNIVKEATKDGIPVHYERPTLDDITNWVENYGIDLFVSAEYDYIIPIPNNDKFRGINLHSSILPLGRSYYPIECALDKGQKQCGITIHKLISQVDGGEILAQAKFPITKKTDSIDCYLYSSCEALRMIKDLFCNFDTNWNNAQPQIATSPYWKRPAIEKMTLSHTICKRQALAMFYKFNQMTEVELNEKIYYVQSLSVGNAPLENNDFLFLDEKNVLYSIADGHLRLTIKEKTSKHGGKQLGEK